MKPTPQHFQSTPRSNNLTTGSQGDIRDMELEKVHAEIEQFSHEQPYSSSVCEQLCNLLNAEAPSLDFSTLRDEAEIQSMQKIPSELISRIANYRNSSFAPTLWEISWPSRIDLRLPEWLAAVPDWLSTLGIEGKVEGFDSKRKNAAQYDLRWDPVDANVYPALATPAQEATIDYYNTKFNTRIDLPKNKKNNPINLDKFVQLANEILNDQPLFREESDFRISFAIDCGGHSMPLAFIRSSNQSCWLFFDSRGPSLHMPALRELRARMQFPIHLVSNKSQIGPNGCRVHTIGVGKALTRTHADGNYLMPSEYILRDSIPIEGEIDLFYLNLPAELLVFSQSSDFINAHRGASDSKPVRRRNSGNRTADQNLSGFFARHNNPVTRRRDYLRCKGLRTILRVRINYYAKCIQKHCIPWSLGLTRAFYHQAKGSTRSANAGHGSIGMSWGQEADIYRLMQSALQLDKWLAQYQIIAAPVSNIIAPESNEWESMLGRSLLDRASVQEQRLTFDLGVRASDVLPNDQVGDLFKLGIRHASQTDILTMSEKISWTEELFRYMPAEITDSPLSAAVGPVLRAINTKNPSLCGKLLLMALSNQNVHDISGALELIKKLDETQQKEALLAINIEGSSALSMVVRGEPSMHVSSIFFDGLCKTLKSPLMLVKSLEYELVRLSINHHQLDDFDIIMTSIESTLTKNFESKIYKKIWRQLESTALARSDSARKLKRCLDLLLGGQPPQAAVFFVANSMMTAIRSGEFTQTEILFRDISILSDAAIKELWSTEDDDTMENLLAVALQGGSQSAAIACEYFLEAKYPLIEKVNHFSWAERCILYQGKSADVSEFTYRIGTALVQLIQSDRTISKGESEKSLLSPKEYKK